MAYRKPYKSNFANTEPTGAKKRGNPNWNGYKKQEPVVRGSAYKPILNPTEEQTAIINHIHNSNNSLVIFAYAGCSKTSSIVEAMRGIPENKKMLYVIYANRNAREAESKCEARVDVSTVHSLGLRVLRSAYGSKVEVDAKGEKDAAIARALVGPADEQDELRYNLIRAWDFAKGNLCETVDQVIAVMNRHEIELCGMKEDEFAKKVLEGMDLAAQQYMRVSFSDMIWLSIKKNLSFPQYDYVFGDEFQDNSLCRLELTLRCVKPGGKLIAVGDVNQRLFGFASAHEDAMKMARERMNADVLPLRTTFRCSQSVVRFAQSIVPDYVAAESNPEGSVNIVSSNDMSEKAKPGSAILSRTNAPLVKTCMEFIKRGQRAIVMGKDLGRQLTYMIKRSNAKDVNSFIIWLDGWKDTECARLIEKRRKCDHITDRYDVLMTFCEGTNDLDSVKREISDMFSDDEKYADSRITCSTTHKYKGMESDTVYLLADTFKPGESDEENFVWYVAITRAKTELNIVK